jgi:NAD-dependent dihydropyrimidine dehydrogenase PreA subunit
MSFVVADKCIGTVDHSCVEVCPVDCIYDVGEDPENPDEPLMVVIDPEECIGCGACVPECPVEAIAPIELVHEKWGSFIQINAMITGRNANDGPEGSGDPHEDIAAAAQEEHARLNAA